MADELQQTAPETTVVDQPNHAAELAAQMAIALNGGMTPQSSEPAASTEPAQPTETNESGDAPAATQAATTQNDPFGLFKEKYNLETPEAIFKEFDELRAFKALPRLAEFQVPNDESGAILKALAAGKKEDVWKILDREIRIDRLVGADVTKENAGDIVKMGMQLKFTDLSPEEINYKFNKQYSIPPEPKQMAEEEDTDYQERVSVWKEQANDKYMDLMIEAKLAKPEIQKAKGKFEIPDIESPVDEGYVQYQKMLEENTKQDEATRAAYKLMSPKELETKLAFKDEANKIAFEFQHEPDGELFNKAVEIASNADLYWKTFTNPDGTPNRSLFLDSIMFALDKNKVLLSAMNQAKNATIKAQLPDNSQGGLVRQIAQSQEPDELASQMANALKGYGTYK
jgi:hypothetical protein